MFIFLIENDFNKKKGGKDIKKINIKKNKQKKQLTEVGGTSESIMKVLSNKFQNNTRNSQKIESTNTLTT